MDGSRPTRTAETGNACAWFLDRHVNEGRGGNAVLVDPWRSLDYATLRDEAARFAGALSAAHVGRERRIALLLLDTVEFGIAFWGAIRCGVVPIPINTLLPPEAVAYILADSRAEVAVVSAPLLAALAPVFARMSSLRLVVVADPGDEAPEVAPFGARVGFEEFLASGKPQAEPVDVPPDECAFWLYSSGSTGSPKGVKHVHASLRATAETYGAQVLGIEEGDVVHSAAKLFFAYGLGNALTFPMSVGACAVLNPGRPTPEAVAALMRAHRPSVFCGVPTLYAAMLAAGIGKGAGSDRLRRCISAGEALPEAVGQRWQEAVGVEILDGIGSTEMLHIFVSNRPGAVRYGTSGQAVPGYDLRVLDDDGNPVPDGEVGELVVRGPSAAEGYWNQRARSQRTFAGAWTWTGDKYVREPDGYYRYAGRADDMFKVSGIWVSPFEVEAALIAHDGVLEAAVVGHQDTDGLTRPRAFVVLQHGVAASATLAEALKLAVKERAGPWKYPRWIEFVDVLPKTATGKIQRFKLREGGTA